MVVRAESEKAATEALEAAIAYPPHDTPVRLLGMFASKTSPAYAAWNAAIAAGRVMDKGVFSDTDADADTWMAERLNKYFPGMIDGIYAETAADAVIAANALIAAGRDDMEVFCAGSNGTLLTLMGTNPRVVVFAYGADEAAAGKVCLELAMQCIAGETVGGATVPSEAITPDK